MTNCPNAEACSPDGISFTMFRPGGAGKSLIKLTAAESRLSEALDGSGDK